MASNQQTSLFQSKLRNGMSDVWLWKLYLQVAKEGTVSAVILTTDLNERGLISLILSPQKAWFKKKKIKKLLWL